LQAVKAALKIPVVANGNVKTVHDADECMSSTGTTLLSPLVYFLLSQKGGGGVLVMLVVMEVDFGVMHSLHDEVLEVPK